MRLGDLDALKKAIEDYAEKRQDTLLWQADIEELIDNAPTIKGEILTKEAYSDLCLRASKERPQGEWIVEKDVYCRCPFCNFKDVKYSNYCPDCGASMRPKPNQLRDCENCVHHSENGCESWKCEFKKRSDL